MASPSAEFYLEDPFALPNGLRLDRILAMKANNRHLPYNEAKDLIGEDVMKQLLKWHMKKVNVNNLSPTETRFNRLKQLCNCKTDRREEEYEMSLLDKEQSETEIDNALETIKTRKMYYEDFVFSPNYIDLLVAMSPRDLFEEWSNCGDDDLSDLLLKAARNNIGRLLLFDYILLCAPQEKHIWYNFLVSNSTFEKLPDNVEERYEAAFKLANNFYINNVLKVPENVWTNVHNALDTHLKSSSKPLLPTDLFEGVARAVHKNLLESLGAMSFLDHKQSNNFQFWLELAGTYGNRAHVVQP